MKYPKIRKGIKKFLLNESWKMTKGSAAKAIIWSALFAVAESSNATNFWSNYTNNTYDNSIDNVSLIGQHWSSCHASWLQNWHFNRLGNDVNNAYIVWSHSSHGSHGSHGSHCSCC